LRTARLGGLMSAPAARWRQGGWAHSFDAPHCRQCSRGNRGGGWTLQA
jgi:hypothetical protein